MNKSVYSLVLSDEIVQEIDRLAYEAGASRSAMINQILADYVRYTTPEKRMREVFSAIEQMLLGSVFEPQLQPSEQHPQVPSAQHPAPPVPQAARASSGRSIVGF